MNNRRAIALLSGITIILLVICIVQAFTIAQLRESLLWAEVNNRPTVDPAESTDENARTGDTVSGDYSNGDPLAVASAGWLEYCKKAQDIYNRSDFNEEAVIALLQDTPEMAKYAKVQRIMKDRMELENEGYSKDDEEFINKSLDELGDINETYHKKGVADSYPTCSELVTALRSVFNSDDIFVALSPYYLGPNFEKVYDNYLGESAYWSPDALKAAAKVYSL